MEFPFDRILESIFTKNETKFFGRSLVIKGEIRGNNVSFETTQIKSVNNVENFQKMKHDFWNAYSFDLADFRQHF